MIAANTARLFLTANAVFSSLSGIAMLIFASRLSQIIFVNPAAWATLAFGAIGVGLLLFSMRLFQLATRKEPRARDVLKICVADGVWVIASTAFVAIGAPSLTGNGASLILVVACIISIFAIGQFVGARQISCYDPSVTQLNAAKTGIGRWLRLGFGCAGVLLAATILAAFVFQTTANVWESARYTAPGKMIDVGGTALYVHCTGPTEADVIVLENGMGLVSENWDWVQKSLSQSYRVCAYDRAGIGHSEAAVRPTDAQTSADNLVELLVELNVEGPILMVGHSYGALISRIFAHRHPDKTAGLVLVDSSHEDMAQRLPPKAQAGFEKMLSGFAILRHMNHLGGARMMGVADRFASGLAAPTYARSYHLYSTSEHMKGAALEAAMWEKSTEQARKVALERLGDLPLTVVMAGGWPNFMVPAWEDMQSDLAKLSNNGRITIISEADHFQILGSEAFALQVAAQIQDVAEQVFRE